MEEGRAGTQSGAPGVGERLANAARPMVGVVLAFVCVISLAVGIFIWRRGERILELEDHYARAVAHIGEQIELRFRNYTQVVHSRLETPDSVLRLQTSLDSVKASEEARKVADKSLDQANQQLEQTRRIASRVHELYDKLNGDEQKKADEASKAIRRESDAAEQAEEAYDSLLTCQIAVRRVHEAADAVDAAAKLAADQATSERLDGAPQDQLEQLVSRATEHAAHARDARTRAAQSLFEARQALAVSAGEPAQELGSGRATKGSNSLGTARANAAVESDSPATVGAAAAASPAALSPDPDRLAHEIRTAAADALQDQERASTAAKEADELLKAAERRRADAQSALDTARSSVTQALENLVSVTVSRQDAHDAAKKIAEEEQHRQQAVRQRFSDRLVITNEHSKALSSVDSAKIKLKEILDRTLPSHRPIVEKCLAAAGDGAQACILGELSRQGAVSAGVAMVNCPKELQPGAALVRSVGDQQTGELLLRGTGAQSACGAVPLERWLGLSRDAPGPIDSELGFDQVALISGDGQVLYAPGDDSTLRIQKLPDVVDKTSTSSMLRAVEIGTTRYRVFHQPLAVEPLMHCDDEKAVSSAESAERGCTEKAQLGIVGLVREDRLATESYRVSPTSFLWAILLVGLGILSLPLAKLWFIGPRSRLRRFDVALLATSAVCVTLLAVVLTLTFAARNRLLSRLDGELQSVGFDTSRELSARLEGGASVLNDFVVRSQDERRSIRNAQLAAPGERVAACAGSFAWLKGNDGEPTWPICETAQATLLNNTYEWRLAFWANEQGQQQVKYLPGRIGTNAVNVEGRGYFQNARAGQVDCLARKGCASDVEHWGTAEVVRSATTGDIVLVVARPTLNDEQKVDGVAAVELPLDGLEAPLLPLGMQMAVIDEDGRVMLHSNNDGHHGQRLFDQIDHLAELRATLAARTSSAMMLRYLGVPSRAWITPLAGTDWHVLTLSPLAVADAPAAGMLLVTLVGFASYVVGILLLVGCFVFVKGALRWLNPDSVKNADLGILSLRPDGTRSRAYANAALGLIVWSSLACVFAVWIGASLPLILLLATSLLVGGILALGVPGLGDGSETSIIGRSYRRIGSLVTRWSREASRSQAPALPVSTADRRKRSWKDDITLAYALCYFGLAGAFIAVPATIWFASAFDHFAEGVVRAEQHHLARALRYRHDCVLSLADGTEPLERPGACQGLFDGGVLEPAAPAEPAEASAVPVAAPNGRTSLAAAAPGVSLDNPAGTPGAVGAGRRLRNWLASGCSQLQPTWPIRCLVDSLPPFEALQGSASARLYRAAEFSATSLSLENAWAWLRSTGRLILVLPGTPSARVESAVPQLFDQEYDVATLVLLLALFGVFLTCAHTAAFHSMRRLFALDVIARWQRTPPVDLEELLHDLGNAARGRSGRKLLVVYPPSQMLSTLRANNGWTELGSGGSGGASRYVPNLIDVLNDDATLQLVATAARAPGSLIVLASADPFRRLSDPLAARWAQALEPFDTVRSIGASAAATPAPLSRARCERLWEDSDEAERRMMGQLAIDGYANLAPENTDTVEQLTARNIFGKHNLTFANPSFARFVRTKISASDLDTWDQSDGGSLWSTVRVPLATSVAAAVAIFGSSAPELTATGAALVPTIAAGFPTVLRVLLSLAQGETPGD